MGEGCRFVEKDSVHEVDCHIRRWCSERAAAEVASAVLAERSVILGRTGREIVGVVRMGYISWVVEWSGE